VTCLTQIYPKAQYNPTNSDVSDGQGALIDPGGNMTYNALMLGMGKYFHFRKLNYIFASHQDPDIVASINKMVGWY